MATRVYFGILPGRPTVQFLLMQSPRLFPCNIWQCCTQHSFCNGTWTGSWQCSSLSLPPVSLIIEGCCNFLIKRTLLRYSSYFTLPMLTWFHATRLKCFVSKASNTILKAPLPRDFLYRWYRSQLPLGPPVLTTSLYCLCVIPPAHVGKAWDRSKVFQFEALWAKTAVLISLWFDLRSIAVSFPQVAPSPWTHRQYLQIGCPVDYE